MPVRWKPSRPVAGPITSTTNHVVKDVVRLHRTRGRREAGLILVEGPQLVGEAVNAGVVVEFALTTDAERFPDATAVSDEVLAKASTTEHPNSVVLVARRPEEATLDAREHVLVAWDIADPGNVGALIRSAAAFGMNVVLTGERSADPWSPKALRAAAGGHFHTSVVTLGSLSVADLEQMGWLTAATVASGGDRPRRGDVPTALLVGSEAHGLPPEVRDACGELWTIPTRGVESLNAAVAGSIAMHALVGGTETHVD